MKIGTVEFERDWMDWFHRYEPFFSLAFEEPPRMPSDRLFRPDAFRFRLFRWLP